MKIAIMLRHFEQKDGGVSVYTRNILPLLFSLGPQHEFVLLYRNPRLIGTYREHPNVVEVGVGAVGSVIWDQVAVPWLARRHQVDFIFNPKFTVPLFTGAKCAFVLHGSEWFVINDQFPWYDRLYRKCAMPLYLRFADAIISVSEAVRRDAISYAGASGEKLITVHNGFDPEAFHPISDPRRLREVSAKYSLPEKFILWVGQIVPRKNVARLLQAFSKIRDSVRHDLVIAGEQRYGSAMTADLKLIDDLRLHDRVRFTGWIGHDDLAAVYGLADLFAFPSLYEGFGIPLLEAMACGCPIVTANTCAPPEVAGDAAYLVDPLNVDAIAAGMLEMLTNASLRETKTALGLRTAEHFSWTVCARGLLNVFEALAASGDSHAIIGIASS